MTYARDTVVIESARVDWTEGKAVGFIPWSFFVKDESANRDEEAIGFYQPFGFAPPRWQAIDEHPFPEAAFSDYCEALGMLGRFARYRVDGKMPEGETWAVAIARAVRMLAEAGLEASEDFSFDEWEQPRLSLVPEWNCFISHDAHLALIEKEKWASVKAFLERQVRELCQACAGGSKLFGDGYRFYHRKNFAFVRCDAQEQHDELETEAWAMWSKETAAQYHLLRGYLNSYTRTRSSRRKIRSLLSFRHLVELGHEMVPFILKDLQEGTVGGIWSAEVLAELTGRRGGTDPEWWLAWAKSENYEVSFEER